MSENIQNTQPEEEKLQNVLKQFGPSAADAWFGATNGQRRAMKGFLTRNGVTPEELPTIDEGVQEFHESYEIDWKRLAKARRTVRETITIDDDHANQLEALHDALQQELANAEDVLLMQELTVDAFNGLRERCRAMAMKKLVASLLLINGTIDFRNVKRAISTETMLVEMTPAELLKAYSIAVQELQNEDFIASDFL